MIKKVKKVKLELRYRCRNCGAERTYLVNKKDRIKGDFLQGINLTDMESITPLTCDDTVGFAECIHKCSDTTIGICHLISAEEIKEVKE